MGSLILTLLAALGSILSLPAQGRLLEEQHQQGDPKLPALFVFGDSTVDSGNNNALTFTILKANFYPNGIDFPNHEPTGRFGNGYLPTDFIAETLGLPLAPPYFNKKTNTSQYKQGVNFASGGSGSVDSTAAKWGVISLKTQVDAFRQDYRDKLVAEVGEDKAAHIIKEALYVLSTGNNDYLNNYLLDPLLQRLVSPENFQDQMIEGTVSFFEAIHAAGARRMATLSLTTLGCLPSQKTRFASDILDNSECVQFINEFARGFNQKMEKAVADLQDKFTDSIIIFADIFDLFDAMVDHPEQYDMLYRRDACCGHGLFEAAIACNSGTSLCPDASKYIFWDSFHPSQHSYKVISDFLWDKYSQDLLAELPNQTNRQLQ